MGGAAGWAGLGGRMAGNQNSEKRILLSTGKDRHLLDCPEFFE